MYSGIESDICCEHEPLDVYFNCPERASGYSFHFTFHLFIRFRLNAKCRI